MSTRRPWLLAPLAAVGACIGLPGSSVAAGTPPRTYAVVSLIGNRFMVVTRRAETGTGLDHNDKHVVEVESSVLDEMAIDAAEDTIAAAQPLATHLRTSVGDRRLFALQDELLAPRSDADGSREAIRRVLAQHGATHLLMITKRRAPAAFDIPNGTAGRGMVEGVGFYIDNVERVRIVATGEVARGYMAPYAFVTVSLVELATLRLMGSSRGGHSTVILPTDKLGVALAWDALTPGGKVAAMKGSIDSAVSRATNEVIAAA